MIRPLRRYHRRLIAAVIVTLTIAALAALTHRAPDVRMDTLPAPLLPAGPDGAARPLTLPSPLEGERGAAPSPRRAPRRAVGARWAAVLRGEGWGERRQR
jgi:hypothetical protein